MQLATTVERRLLLEVEDRRHGERVTAAQPWERRIGRRWWEGGFMSSRGAYLDMVKAPPKVIKTSFPTKVIMELDDLSLHT